MASHARGHPPVRQRVGSGQLVRGPRGGRRGERSDRRATGGHREEGGEGAGGDCGGPERGEWQESAEGARRGPAG